MADRSLLNSLAQITVIQAVQRTQAQVMLEIASRSHDDALSAAEHATIEARDALGDWNHFLDRPLSFDYQRDLARRAITLEHDAERKRDIGAAAGDLFEQRRSAWQSTDAKVRMGQENLKRARRRFARKCDERDAHRTEAMTTWRWFGR